MNPKRALALIAVALALTGCLKGILPKAEERAVYGLPLAIPMQAKRPLAGALLVEVPRALAPLDGPDVVIVRADGEVQLLPGVRWIAPAPLLLQDLIARQIETAGAAPSVAQTAQAYRLPLRLSSDLRAFEAHEDGPSLRIHTELVVRLICAQNARVIASSPPIVVDTAAIQNQAAMATAALRDASSLLARRVVLWMDTVDASNCSID